MKRHQQNKHFLVHPSFWRKKTESTYTIRQYLTSASTEWRAGSFTPFADKLSSSDESSYRKCGSEKGRDDAKFSVAFAAAKQIYAFVHHIIHTQSLRPINAYHIIYKYQILQQGTKATTQKKYDDMHSEASHILCTKFASDLDMTYNNTLRPPRTYSWFSIQATQTTSVTKVRFAEHPNHQSLYANRTHTYLRCTT